MQLSRSSGSTFRLATHGRAIHIGTSRQLRDGRFQITPTMILPLPKASLTKVDFDRFRHDVHSNCHR